MARVAGTAVGFFRTRLERQLTRQRSGATPTPYDIRQDMLLARQQQQQHVSTTVAFRRLLEEQVAGSSASGASVPLPGADSGEPYRGTFIFDIGASSPAGLRSTWAR